MTGISLRDYIAMNASENDIREYMDFEFDWDGPIAMFGVAKYSPEQARYRFADAMLKARGEDYE